MKQMISNYLFIIFFCTLGWSQKWPSEEYAKKNNYLEVIGDTIGMNQNLVNPKFPMYPNGANGINSLIVNNMRYPDTQVMPKNKGKVLLKYVVEVNGEIGDIEIIQSSGKYFDDEAIRVLKKMKRWIPGNVNGEIVKFTYTQPFRFNYKNKD